MNSLNADDFVGDFILNNFDVEVAEVSAVVEPDEFFAERFVKKFAVAL